MLLLLSLPVGLSAATQAGWSTATSLLPHTAPAPQDSALERLNGPTWTRIGTVGALYAPEVRAPAPFGALAPNQSARERATLARESVPDPTTPLDELEQAVLQKANADRLANGLPAFERDAALVPLARQRALDQTTLARVSHYDQTGAIPLRTLLEEAQVSYARVGENIARQEWQGTTSAARIQEAFMASPSHRSVLLDPRLDRAGIGATVDARGRLTVVQLFRSLAP